MPSPTGKGKKSLDEVKEYDPHHQGAIGHWRVKTQKSHKVKK